MKTMNEINNIICHVMTDNDFDHVLEAAYDRDDLDKRVAYNGKRRLVRALNKYGLTLTEWDAWDAM